MRCTLSIYLCLLTISTSHALEEHISTGARPLGMGEAFTAIADDANSIRRNPAGMPRLGMYAFEFERTPSGFFGEFETNYLSAVLPITERSAFGADWMDVGIEDDELNAGHERFNFSYGYLPLHQLSLGFNLKYITHSVSLDGQSRGTSIGWGADFGLMFQPNSRWSIGLLTQDFLGFGSGKGFTRGMAIRHDTGFSEKIFPTIYKLGVAYQPRARWQLAADLTDRIHVGGEFLLDANFAVRAGVQKDLRTSEAPTYSVGGSVRYRSLNFNAAYLMPPTLPSTAHVGLSVHVDYRKLPVQIEHIRVRDLYPVHYHYYATPNHAAQIITYNQRITPPVFTDSDLEIYYPLTSLDSIGRIWLKNESYKPVTVHIKLFMDGFVSRDGTEVAFGDIELPARKRISVPFRQLVFTSDALNLRRAQPVQAEVKVVESGGTAHRTGTTTIKLHSNHTTLLDDVAKLGSFITSEDPALHAVIDQIFTRFAEEIDEVERTGVPSSLYQAMLLFNVLYGVSYKTDPNIPFRSGTIDAIKYPYEMLDHLMEQRSEDNTIGTFGDCDDSTALYCSLLESVGIKTALIQLPGHVMMAFKLGQIAIHQAQAVGLPYYTPINGQVWIPVETTLIKDGFVAAWEAGLNQIRDTGVGGSSATVEEAWEKYGLSPIHGAEQEFFIPKNRILTRIKSDLASPWFQEFLRAFVRIAN